MTAALLNFLKPGPVVPRVVLLPDNRFFVRSIPVAENATADDVATQVELTLEGISPFPPAQLYHGFLWAEKSRSALVFAAYRKRFTTDQAAEWAGSELVIPAFAAVSNIEHAPATAVIYPTADGFTGIYWESGPVPTNVLTTQVAADATDEERARARDELLRAFGGSRKVIDLEVAPEVDTSPDENTYVFRAGDVATQLPAATQTEAIDVRDKDELAALRKARARDLLLWRTFAGFAALLLLLVVGELSMIAANMWQKAQQDRIAAQKPVVDKIINMQNLTSRIDDLSTKRLLVIEMIAAVNPVNLVKDEHEMKLRFVEITAQDLTTLVVQVKTPVAAEIDVYEQLLRKVPAVDSVNMQLGQGRGGVTTARFVVKFKSGELKPDLGPGESVAAGSRRNDQPVEL